MELSTHNSVAVLSFDPSAEYPRLTKAALGELDDLLDEIRGKGVFSSVVIAANSTSFATGAEIEEVAAVEGFGAREFAARGQKTLRRIDEFPLPVVAAIRGYCLGGGLDLALACHSRVASYDASFAHPGATLGLVTGWGGTQRLSRLVGRTAALQMFLTAERIPATQALTMGLVDELALSVDLISAAANRAEAMSRLPR
jgi:enoyl-CoA hydratase/carnithine racemase